MEENMLKKKILTFPRITDILEYFLKICNKHEYIMSTFFKIFTSNKHTFILNLEFHLKENKICFSSS